MEEKWSIAKLDSSNWTTWKFQMQHLLLAKELFGHIDGSTTLSAEATTDVRERFKKDSQRTFSLLVMAISDTLIYLITSCATPKDAWDTLKKHFERDNLANKLFLKKKYFRAEMSEGTCVNEHIKFMKELADKLSSCYFIGKSSQKFLYSGHCSGSTS